MRICPVCHTRYDEEILRFCTKDGTPLVEENPTFTQLPSESEEAEDIGEETLIRRNAPAAQPFSDDIEEDSAQPVSGQRIVIPTTEKEKEVVRAKSVPASEQRQANPPRKKSNTALVVLTTMLGTIVVLGVLSGVWYVLSGRKSANTNDNKNINVNLAGNSNLETNLNANSLPVNLDFNSNINANTNTNVNTNVNTNLATPTRTPTPTPTPTPDNANANTNSGLNLGNTNVMTRPSPSPGETPPANTAAPTPRTNPSPETTTTPTQPVNVGIMNSRAVNLVKPAYPQEARQANASGQVTVQIAIDEGGNVTSAKAVNGNLLLRPAAENAARQSRFNPVKVNDRIVKATGTVVYNFINQ